MLFCEQQLPMKSGPLFGTNLARPLTGPGQLDLGGGVSYSKVLCCNHCTAVLYRTAKCCAVINALYRPRQCCDPIQPDLGGVILQQHDRRYDLQHGLGGVILQQRLLVCGTYIIIAEKATMGDSVLQSRRWTTARPRQCCTAVAAACKTFIIVPETASVNDVAFHTGGGQQHDPGSAEPFATSNSVNRLRAKTAGRKAVLQEMSLRSAITEEKGVLQRDGVWGGLCAA
eukprot:1160498-Pelagomonas_calceolata.AAC.6